MSTSVMTTRGIADRLVALCRQGQFEAAHRELFSADAIGLEPYGTPAFPRETRGLDALLEKGRQFTALIEQVHAISVSDPLVAGGNVGAGDLILLKPSDIYKIGDRGVEVSLSTEAAIEMADNPAGDSSAPTANTSVVSMFQTESVAIKVVRPLNFAKRRASAVAYVGDADYGTVSGS